MSALPAMRRMSLYPHILRALSPDSDGLDEEALVSDNNVSDDDLRTTILQISEAFGQKERQLGNKKRQQLAGELAQTFYIAICEPLGIYGPRRPPSPPSEHLIRKAAGWQSLENILHKYRGSFLTSRTIALELRARYILECIGGGDTAKTAEEKAQANYIALIPCDGLTKMELHPEAVKQFLEEYAYRKENKIFPFSPNQNKLHQLLRSKTGPARIPLGFIIRQLENEDHPGGPLFREISAIVHSLREREIKKLIDREGLLQTNAVKIADDYIHIGEFVDGRHHYLLSPQAYSDLKSSQEYQYHVREKSESRQHRRILKATMGVDHLMKRWHIHHRDSSRYRQLLEIIDALRWEKIEQLRQCNGIPVEEAIEACDDTYIAMGISHREQPDLYRLYPKACDDIDIKLQKIMPDYAQGAIGNEKDVLPSMSTNVRQEEQSDSHALHIESKSHDLSHPPRNHLIRRQRRLGRD